MRRARGGQTLASTNQRRTEAPEPDPPDVGSVVDGRYRLVGRLGRGGAGSVFRADDAATGQSLALKLLADDASARVQALFEREYYTLAGMRHPNVVEVFDYGAYAGRPYYTMELLKGSDLSGLAPLAGSVALAYVRDTASALAALHARHLIHRDVAPRNLWLCESGALKLLDFGALTTFGSPGDVVGTPPFVAPEALSGQALDQRTDLYALGALLYWLLTGVHAYPARSLRDLPEAWAQLPVAPSARLEELGRSDLPPISEELDALVLALLSRDPSERPATAGEVIDRIASITGATRSGHVREAAAQIVARPAFVGRQRERKHFARQLKLALSGRGGATLVEADPGLGATRLLAELSLETRLEGAVAVCIDGALAAATGGALAGLVLRLFDARPQQALQAFAPHAAVLSQLGDAVRARLGIEPRASEGPMRADLRAKVEDAVIAGTLAFSARVPLVVLVDDLEQLDDAAVAVLAVLAERAAAARLLLISALHGDSPSRRSASIRAFGRSARRLTLRPLSAEDTLALVRSLFSDVPYLARLAERAQRTTEGNPGHLTELLRELVESEVVRQVDGTWVLPQELPDEPFARKKPEVTALRLGRLSPSARSVARVLSVSAAFMSLATCKAVVELAHRELFAALDELTRAAVLHTGEDGYRFADEALRLALRAELSEADAARAHLALGRHLLADAASLPGRIDAAVHMLEGGERAEAPRLINAMVNELGETDVESLPALAPRLILALETFRAEGRSHYAQIALLHGVAMAGFFSDRRLSDRYGPEGSVLLHRLTGLALASRLQPYLGKALALLVGLLVGAVRFGVNRRRDPCVPRFDQALRFCINLCTSRCGVAAISVARGEARQYAAMLAPLAGFGADHPFTVIAEFPRAIAMASSDHFMDAKRALIRLLERFDAPRVQKLIPADSRARMKEGVMYALAVQHCWFEDEEALRIADQLDAHKTAIGAMTADQVRTLFFANRGDQERFEHHKHRAEMHAVRRGTAWQIETWLPGAMISVAFRARDAMGLKHAIEQMERLEQRTPSLALIRRRAQGAYLVLRRRAVEALPVLEGCLKEDVDRVIGAARAQGVYVRALNAMGQHARALKAGEAALARLTADDRRAWPQTLALQIEYALSRAALGDITGARGLLTEMLAASDERGGTITRGNLHEALAEVELRAGDAAASELHVAQMTQLYRSTGLPTLAAHLQVLARERQRALGQRGFDTKELELTLSGTQGHLTALAFTRLDAELGRGEVRREVLAERALRIVADQGMSKRGSLWYVSGQGVSLSASVGDAPPRELEEWVRERLASAADDDITQTDFLEAGELKDPNQCTLSGEAWELLVLSCQQDGRDVPVAAVVLERSLASKLVSHDLLRALGGRLFQHVTSTLRTSMSQG